MPKRERTAKRRSKGGSRKAPMKKKRRLSVQKTSTPKKDFNELELHKQENEDEDGDEGYHTPEYTPTRELREQRKHLRYPPPSPKISQKKVQPARFNQPNPHKKNWLGGATNISTSDSESQPNRIGPFSQLTTIKNLSIFSNGIPMLIARMVYGIVSKKPIGVVSLHTLYCKARNDISIDPLNFPIHKNDCFVIDGIQSPKCNEYILGDKATTKLLNRSKVSNFRQKSAKSKASKDDTKVCLTVPELIRSGKCCICNSRKSKMCTCRSRCHYLKLSDLQHMTTCPQYHTGKTYYIYGFGRFSLIPVEVRSERAYDSFCIFVNIDGHMAAIQNTLISAIKFFHEMTPSEIAQFNTNEIICDYRDESTSNLFALKELGFDLSTIASECRPVIAPKLSEKFKKLLGNFSRKDNKSFDDLRNRNYPAVLLDKKKGNSKNTFDIQMYLPPSCLIPPFSLLPRKEEQLSLPWNQIIEYEISSTKTSRTAFTTKESKLAESEEKPPPKMNAQTQYNDEKNLDNTETETETEIADSDSIAEEYKNDTNETDSNNLFNDTQNISTDGYSDNEDQALPDQSTKKTRNNYDNKDKGKVLSENLLCELSPSLSLLPQSQLQLSQESQEEEEKEKEKQEEQKQYDDSNESSVNTNNKLSLTKGKQHKEEEETEQEEFQSPIPSPQPKSPQPDSEQPSKQKSQPEMRMTVRSTLPLSTQNLPQQNNQNNLSAASSQKLIQMQYEQNLQQLQQLQQLSIQQQQQQQVQVRTQQQQIHQLQQLLQIQIQQTQHQQQVIQQQQQQQFLFQQQIEQLQRLLTINSTTLQHNKTSKETVEQSSTTTRK